MMQCGSYLESGLVACSLGAACFPKTYEPP